MAIPRDTKIEDIEFQPLESGEKSQRFRFVLANYDTYGEFIDEVRRVGGVDKLPGVGAKRAELLNAFIAQNPLTEEVEQNALEETPYPHNTRSFSITTPDMPLEEKMATAVAGVDQQLINIAVSQFKKGAVVIEP